MEGIGPPKKDYAVLMPESKEFLSPETLVKLYSMQHPET